MTEPDPTPSAAEPSTPAPRGSNVKETIESILVAFILAFIFRSFVVEAFVIPTGSMAPTLLGAHMRFTCNDCGWRFDVNYQNPHGGDEMDVPARSPASYTLFCPNCGYRVPGGAGSTEPGEASHPLVRYGDRILVLKYLYLFEDPKRWDVVVFKSPVDPQKYDYTQNYIKRLIGCPGESIMLLDGDVYVAPRGSAGQLGDFRIATKPPEAQGALWRIVYDNDYYSQNLPGGRRGSWEQPWQPQTPGDAAWHLDGRVFRFASETGGSGIAFNPSANPQTYALTDWLAYDQAAGPDSYGFRPHNVSDLKLSVVYDRQSGDGPFKLMLTKRQETFTAEFTPAKVTLYQDDGSAHSVIGSADLPGGHRAYKIDFTNVDYQVTLRVDGRTVIQSTPQQYNPDVAGLLKEYQDQEPEPRPAIRIEASNQRCDLSHVGLWRDVYYINDGRQMSGDQPDFFWGSPNRPIHLSDKAGQREYYVLGDNSLISGDARYWSDPINLPAENLKVQSGRVPERFMLGKAFFVYWPAGYAPFSTAPNLVPNFGEMRFIH
jgi:signal peptidase I